MINSERTRTAALVVVSHVLSVDDISDLVGCGPDRSRSKGSVRSGAVVPIPAKETSWELCEQADRSVPLSNLLDRLSEKVLPLRGSFVGLVDAGCAFKLTLVQWISEADPSGPGFWLDADLLKFLAEVGASVDVDQYVV
ncbi:DUF4279 domain-containing protein [Micromonospora echinospora]|uniref:DUF4279 domain-containing protein n=1 Tax=Micromonospora echinospora TaxID=1877 RepID=UPI003A89C3F7